MNCKSESPKLELKLNLSPSRDYGQVLSPHGSDISSCVSREVSPDEWSRCPETSTMMLVGCPRCLMYVMLMEEDPKCPKCKSTVLLDFLHEDRNRGIKK